MATLYDLLAGQNPYSRMALAILALEMQQVPRYRDATLLRPTDREPTWRVSILTRTGGPNREHFDASVLTGHELYLSDCDMTVDPTTPRMTSASRMNSPGWATGSSPPSRWKGTTA